MKKDFQRWHQIKQHIHNNKQRLFYHEREIWWCALGVNIGFEMDGKGEKYIRPVIIIKGFSREVCLCIPLTTKQKEGKYYYNLNFKGKFQRKAIISQIRLIDSKRLIEKIGIVDKVNFKEIKQAIIRLIE